MIAFIIINHVGLHEGQLETGKYLPVPQLFFSTAE